MSQSERVMPRPNTLPYIGKLPGVRDFLKLADETFWQISQPTDPRLAIDYTQPGGEAGSFGPDSVTWRMNANPGAFAVGTLASVFLQITEPSVSAGVSENSAFVNDFDGRLRRTGAAAAATVYAAESAKKPMMDRIRRQHENVKGVNADGKAYQAVDPELMRWVFFTAIYYGMKAHLRYVDPTLPKKYRDRYFAEQAAAAKDYGDFDLPKTVDEAHAYHDEMVKNLRGFPFVQDVMKVVRTEAPLGKAFLPLQRLLLEGALDLLPDELLEEIGEKKPMAVRLAIRPWIATFVRLSPLVIRNGPAQMACRRMGVSPRILNKMPKI